MAALLALLLAAGLGFALGWLVRSSGRRVVDIELPEAVPESNPEALGSIDKETVTEPSAE